MYIIILPDGKEHGPVDLTTLRTWITNGNVVPLSQVIDPIDGQIKNASSIPEIARYFPPAQMGPVPAYPGQQQNSQQPNIHVTVTAANQPVVIVGPPKSKIAAILLALFLGGLGIHRFYLGHTGTGVLMLVMFLFGWPLLAIPEVIVAVWVLIDIIMIATGGLKDSYGRPLIA